MSQKNLGNLGICPLKRYKNLADLIDLEDGISNLAKAEHFADGHPNALDFSQQSRCVPVESLSASRPTHRSGTILSRTHKMQCGCQKMETNSNIQKAVVSTGQRPSGFCVFFCGVNVGNGKVPRRRINTPDQWLICFQN